jgi:hypothetical protein
MLSPVELVCCVVAGILLPIDPPQQVLPEKLPPADAALKETFTALTSVRELSDGRVLLSDPREGRLVVADFNNQRVEPLSRKGDGPGEYRNALPFRPLGGDSSVVADGITKRWLFFESDRIVTTRTANDLDVRLVSIPFGFDNRGFVLTTRSPPTDRSGNVRSMADSTYLVLISRANADADTIGRLRPSSRADGKQVPGALRSYEQAVLAFDGWIAVARLEPYRIDWRTPEGRWIRGAPLAVPVERMDDAEKDAYLGQLQPGPAPRVNRLAREPAAIHRRVVAYPDQRRKGRDSTREISSQSRDALRCDRPSGLACAAVAPRTE